MSGLQGRGVSTIAREAYVTGRLLTQHLSAGYGNVRTARDGGHLEKILWARANVSYGYDLIVLLNFDTEGRRKA